MSANTDRLALKTVELYAPNAESVRAYDRLTPRQRKDLRRALARRRLEMQKEEQWLREAIYDVLEDSDAVH